MIKDLKFRVWNKRTSELEYMHNLYWFEENMIREFDDDDDLIFTQSIGARDETRTDEYPEGRLIYEGDVLQNGEQIQVVKCSLTTSSEHGHGFSVSSEHYGFHFDTMTGLPGQSKIIGNIFQNPEYLK